MAKANCIDIVEIDLLAFEYTPEILNTGITGELLVPLQDFVRQQIVKYGFESIQLSQFKIKYDFSVSRKIAYELPTYDCTCTIQTESGRKYEVKLTEANN
ncbi:hypothetical protein ACFSJY_00800 [Thalassotalea euphylliae]|uniref:hypothetical protein n=1 Tax=Thalassotalea euphylliae TaxID=1655234 RepID=UPI00362BAEB6